MIKWGSSVRLDDYITLKALRRQVALVDKCRGLEGKQFCGRNEELASALERGVGELNQTLRAFNMFSNGSNDIKKRVELMKRVREDLADVFLCSLRVANALDVDVSRSLQDKIYPVLKSVEEPWTK